MRPAMSFFGTPPRVTLQDANLFGANIDPGTANAILTVRTDGTVTQTINGATSTLYTWTTETTTNFDIMFQTVSGTPTGGAGPADAWLNVSANRNIGSSQVGVGSSSFDFTLRVRPAGGGSDLATASVTTDAQVDP